MVLLTARMLLMYVACVTARVTALLDVCGCVVVVLRPVAIMMSSAGTMRVDALGPVSPMQPQ